MSRPPLTAAFRIGDVEIPNRVLLAPLAGIGNWFVRMQAKRHGAGMAVSEMISSHAVFHDNERTMRQLLVVKPEEHPVSLQLFGSDPSVMREAAARVAAAGADIVDLNMGCPVKKVRKSGAGVELLSEPGLAVELARAAREGSGRPVTVKLRSGLEPGDRSGFELALRLVGEAGVAAVCMHPRPATLGHRGRPDFALVRELAGLLDVPVIVSGGLADAERARRAYEDSGADAIMVARGSFGYPWIFGELTGRRSLPPEPAEIAAELLWIVGCAEEHLGPRAAHYLRKFYPWYLDRLGVAGAVAHRFQTCEDLAEARRMIAALAGELPGAAAPARRAEASVSTG